MSLGLGRLFRRRRIAKTPDEREQYSFTTCPRCGQTYDQPQHYCSRCHYYSPHWWWRSGSGQPRSPWRMRLLLISLLLLAVVGYLGYEFHPFIPNPIHYIKRPSTRLSAPVGPDTWSEFGRDSAHTRYVPDGASPAGRIRWSVSLGPPTLSSPAVVDGVLYVGAHFRVVALDAATGRQLWESSTTGPVHASPAVAGDRLYVGLLDGRIIALDRASGRPDWAFQTGNFVFSSATVKNGRLFIGSGDESIYCLDVETGQVLWRIGLEGRVLSPPAVQDGIVYAATDNRNLHSLSARTGSRRLMFRMAQDIIEAPVVGNGLAYFAARDGRLYAIHHGAREWPGQFQVTWLWIQFWLWRLPVPPPPPQAGAAWRFNPKFPRQGLASPPAVTPEAFYVGDRLGIFYACEPTRAKPLWRFRIRSPIIEAPLVVGNRVYFGAEDSRLYALDRKTGKETWRLELGAPILAGPVYGAGLIFVRTKDGMLHAVE